MTFPVYIHAFGGTIHPHALFDVLAYALGFQTYRLFRSRESVRVTTTEQQLWILAAAIGGAVVFSKLLAWVESWPQYWAIRDNPTQWLGAKTIVGGLLGGWIGVEIAKKILGIRRSTGDAYVPALIVGTAVGRVGCFLTGLPDQTYGTPTSLPWAIDFGDGIPRHPTQLYEIAVVLLIGALLLLFRSRRSPRGTAGSAVIVERRVDPNHGRAAHATGRRDPSDMPRDRAGLHAGTLFRLYLTGYLLFRFGVEFIKPSYKPYGGVSAIQIASLAGASVALWQVIRLRRRDPLVGPT